MQFSTSTHETPQATPNFHNIIVPIIMNKNHQILLNHHRGNSAANAATNGAAAAAARPWAAGFASAKALGIAAAAASPQSFGDANCMEQLLVHCANAIESNDATLAQQILWVLNNIATPDGDANQRLACAFLRALVSRAARRGCSLLAAADNPAETHRFSVVELANFIDLTPWHRFGFTAANAAILDAAEGFPVVHIVDLGLTHCMQMPTLLDAFATRHEVPPLIKLTVVAESESLGDDAASALPPTLDLSYEELGRKLVGFARTRNVALEFRVVVSTYADGFSSLIEQLRVQNLISIESNSVEALVVNCQMRLHHIPEEAQPLRAMFLKALRGLDPTAVVLVDEDADLSSGSLVCRLRAAFNYLWIPYDTVDTFLPRGSRQRQWYEADIGWKVENVVAGEGLQRVERQEPKTRWAQRMRAARFRGVGFGEDAAAEVKAMLDEHAAGWGVKREEEDLVLTWKGHNVVFATVWVPA